MAQFHVATLDLQVGGSLPSVAAGTPVRKVTVPPAASGPRVRQLCRDRSRHPKAGAKLPRAAGGVGRSTQKHLLSCLRGPGREPAKCERSHVQFLSKSLCPSPAGRRSAALPFGRRPAAPARDRAARTKPLSRTPARRPPARHPLRRMPSASASHTVALAHAPPAWGLEPAAKCFPSARCGHVPREWRWERIISISPAPTRHSTGCAACSGA